MDPLNPPDADTVDLESDSLDSSSVGFSPDVADTPAPAPSAPPPAAKAEAAPKDTPAPASDIELDSDSTSDVRRDERGRFAAAQEAAAKPPAKDGDETPGQRRFSKRIEKMRAEVDALTRQKRDLERELQGSPQPRVTSPAPAEAKAPAPGATQAPAAAADAPDWDTFEAAGKTYKEYQAAERAWLLDQAEARALAKIEAKSQTAEATARDQEAKAAHQKRLADVRTAHPDFDTVIEAASNEGIELHDFVAIFNDRSPQGFETLYQLSQPEHHEAVDAINDYFERVTPQQTFPLMDALLVSEDPARLLLALADTQLRAEIDQALRLTSRPAALAALVRLDARLSARATPGSRPTPAPRSKATPPPSHVAGSRAAGAATSGQEADVDAYYRNRMKGLSPADALRSA